jgi:hypothetical protein
VGRWFESSRGRQKFSRKSLYIFHIVLPGRPVAGVCEEKRTKRIQSPRNGPFQIQKSRTIPRTKEQAQNAAETGMPRDGHGAVRVFRRPRSPYWWYDFYVGNVRYCESSKQTDEVAAQVVAEARRDLAASGRSREADLAAARAIIKKYAPAAHAVVDPSAWEALAGAIADALEAERARTHARRSNKRLDR